VLREQDDAVLLEVDNLQTAFRTADGIVRAVDGVSFAIDEGETLAIVGESGCGKSVTASSILRLIPQPPGRLAGAIRYRGVDLLTLSERDMRKIRGKEIGMVFQEPMTSLNPVLTIGQQLTEPLRLHEGLDRAAAAQRAAALLAQVGLPEPQQRLHDYPHRLSGGMQQRVMIAMALACNPRLLIADEPTTALDVTVQAQILALIRDVQLRSNTAVLLITHDMGVVADIAARVVVMYAGRKVEEAPAADIFRAPRHPYTRALLGAVPRLRATRLGATRLGAANTKLAEIPGAAPSPTLRPAGCTFASRCASATELCRRVTPALELKAPGHLAACHHAPNHAVAA
jgi:peptide/nickel transport system ATP-binding protein